MDMLRPRSATTGAVPPSSFGPRGMVLNQEQGRRFLVLCVDSPRIVFLALKTDGGICLHVRSLCRPFTPVRLHAVSVQKAGTFIPQNKSSLINYSVSLGMHLKLYITERGFTGLTNLQPNLHQQSLTNQDLIHALSRQLLTAETMRSVCDLW
jgi:hypothetical protein